MSRFVKSLRRLYRANRVDQVRLTEMLNGNELTNEEYNWIIAEDNQEQGGI